MGTHPDIKDQDLRAILANELLILRNLLTVRKLYSREEVYFIKIGIFTALRRVQYLRDKAVTK